MKKASKASAAAATPTTAFEETQESHTAEEASRRAEGHPRTLDDVIEFPTWRYAADGRTAIVNSPQQLEELEEDGGDWQDRPHPAKTEFVPNGVRTFAAPVGSVDPRGAIARTDRPLPELALTTALPRNVQESVPSTQAETRQRQAAQVNRQADSPLSAELSRLSARIDALERDNRDLRAGRAVAKQAAAPKKASGKKSHKKKTTGDAREDARRDAADRQRAENADAAEAQSRAAGK